VGGRNPPAVASPFGPVSVPPTHECAPDPLEIFREALALARRTGMSWFEAERPAFEAALSVEPDPAERDDWIIVLHDTRTAWMRAYERRPANSTL
jgi:hypothetical protein